MFVLLFTSSGGGVNILVARDEQWTSKTKDDHDGDEMEGAQHMYYNYYGKFSLVAG